jgi:hypothetical protein
MVEPIAVNTPNWRSLIVMEVWRIATPKLEDTVGRFSLNS